MNRTMIFENGRVVVRGGKDIPAIEPIGETVSEEELAELFKRHGFDQPKKDETE